MMCYDSISVFFTSVWTNISRQKRKAISADAFSEMEQEDLVDIVDIGFWLQHFKIRVILNHTNRTTAVYPHTHEAALSIYGKQHMHLQSTQFPDRSKGPRGFKIHCALMSFNGQQQHFITTAECGENVRFALLLQCEFQSMYMFMLLRLLRPKAIKISGERALVTLATWRWSQINTRPMADQWLTVRKNYAS